jgi:hypothetical protein
LRRAPDRLGKFLRLPLAEQLLFLRIVPLLGFYRLLLRRRRLDRLTRHLQHSATVVELPIVDAPQQQRARRIGYLVAAAALATPWESRCLTQVMAVQHLLRRAGIPGQFLLGVPAARAAPAEASLAHAWVLVGTEVVNGGAVKDYAVLSSYRWGGAV